MKYIRQASFQQKSLRLKPNHIALSRKQKISAEKKHTNER